MHEWALAEAVVSTVLDLAQKEKMEEVTRIEIRMGEFQQIDRDIFEFALKEVILPQKSLLQNTEIEIETEEAVLKCHVCGNEWMYGDVLNDLDEDEIESIHFIPEIAHVCIKCPGCGSPDFEISKGRGVWIHNIQGK